MRITTLEATIPNPTRPNARPMRNPANVKRKPKLTHYTLGSCLDAWLIPEFLRPLFLRDSDD